MSDTSELLAQQILNGSINKKTWGGILYNVYVFGAKGDGVNDDTQAVQDAIDTAVFNNGTLVYFPPGTYKVTSLSNTSTIHFVGDNATFVGYSGTITQLGSPNVSLNVKDYGAKGDGVTDDTSKIASAITAATVSGGVVVFPPGTYVTNSLTVPSNVTLSFSNGAKLSVNTGQTVTINGPINAEQYQIFSGFGTIAGTPKIKEVKADWFGLPANETTDGAVSIQKAVIFAQQAYLPLSLPANRRIRLDSQIVIEQGRVLSTDIRKELTLYGNNARIFGNFNGAIVYVKPLCPTASTGSGNEVGNVNIYDLNFDNYYGVLNGLTGTKAIRIGNAGFKFDGFQTSKFVNILAEGFITPPFKISSARMIDFVNVISRSGGVLIECLTNGEFSGDMTFEKCQFTGTETNRPIELSGFSASGVQPEVRSIRFDNCVIYGAGTYINASTNAKIADIWFENCAWDGPGAAAGQKAIYIFANGTSTISQVFIDEPYIVNYLGQAIYAQTDNTSTIEHFRVLGGHIALIDAPGTEAAIKLISIEHALIHGVTFTFITGQDVIFIDGGCTHISVQSNSLQKSTGVTYFVTLGAVTDFMVTNNIGTKPMNDASGAVNKLVANNLLTTT